MLMLHYTVFIFATLLTAVCCQSVSITGNISEGEIVCPGQVVTFTCVTRGSQILSWVSEVYIGNTNFPILQGTNLNQRIPARLNSNTFATLVNDTMEGSVVVLVSELRIIVSSESLTPSVTCLNPLDGNSKTITFQVPGEPSGVSQVTMAGYVMGTCELSISLNASGNITTGDTIQVGIDGNIRNVAYSDNVTSLTVSYTVSRCAILNVSARILDHCGREGPSSSIVTVDPQVCDPSACATPPSTDDTPPSTDDTPPTSDLSAGIVVAIVVPIVAVVIIATLVFLAVVIGLCCYSNSKKNTPKRVSDINLDTKNGEEDSKLS